MGFLNCNTLVNKKTCGKEAHYYVLNHCDDSDAAVCDAHWKIMLPLIEKVRCQECEHDKHLIIKNDTNFDEGEDDETIMGLCTKHQIMIKRVIKGTP